MKFLQKGGFRWRRFVPWHKSARRSRAAPMQTHRGFATGTRHRERPKKLPQIIEILWKLNNYIILSPSLIKFVAFSTISSSSLSRLRRGALTPPSSSPALFLRTAFATAYMFPFAEHMV